MSGQDVWPGAPGLYTPAILEIDYQAQGPSDVTTTVTTEACDREGHVCDLYYPSDIELLDRLPVLAWANGTGQLTENYDYWLRHLASWGFIVVSSRDTDTADGASTLDAANYVIAQSETVGSEFYRKADAARVGAAGHSQGAGSVIRLFQDMQAPFSSFVAIHPPPWLLTWWVSGVTADKLGRATKGSILLLNSDQDGGATDLKRYYRSITQVTVTKAYGVLRRAQHDDVMGAPSCSNVSSGRCVTGVYGYLGYPTQWFLWNLAGEDLGPTAFHSTEGEFVGNDADWSLRETSI